MTFLYANLYFHSQLYYMYVIDLYAHVSVQGVLDIFDESNNYYYSTVR